MLNPAFLDKNPNTHGDFSRRSKNALATGLMFCLLFRSFIHITSCFHQPEAMTLLSPDHYQTEIILFQTSIEDFKTPSFDFEKTVACNTSFCYHLSAPETEIVNVYAFCCKERSLDFLYPAHEFT